MAARIILFLAGLASASGAFVPKAFVPRRIHRLSKTDIRATPNAAFEYEADLSKGKHDVSFEPDGSEPPTPKPPTPEQSTSTPAEVFTGVHLPKDKVPPSLNNEYTNKQVGEYLKGAGGAEGIFASYIGKPKTSLSVASDLLKTVNDLGANIPDPGDYNFFGNENHATNLVMILKNNPFMASTLTQNGDGFELKSYDPDEVDPSLFLKVLRTLNGAGHRVNFEFDSNMEITKFEVFDDVTGTSIPGDLNLQEWASSAIYNVLFYSSCVHATIHVFHYLLTSAFQYSSQDFEAMNKWAVTYAKNVPLKYQQVGLLLITNPPPPPIPDPTKVENNFASVLFTYALLTGPAGWGSSQALRPILKDLLDSWGQSKTAIGWLDTMMNVSLEKMKDAGILTEFIKHVDLIEEFAEEASSALSEINQDKFTIAELGMKDYLKSCGSFESTIDTVESWLELMSVTGIVHGSTLSYTRFLAQADIARWRNIKCDTWDTPDLNLITGGLGTIVGMEEGRHVMSSTTDTYAPKLQLVLDKFDEKSTSLKEKYQCELLDPKNRELFNSYGWILSDYCTDDFDGKQLTITTYI
jgi:hypothetical protein